MEDKALETFIEKFREQLELVEDHEILDGDTLFKDMESWDSLAAVMVLGMIEEEYDVALNADSIFEADTVEDLLKIVQGKMKAV